MCSTVALESEGGGEGGADQPNGVELPPYYERPSWAPSWVPTWAVTLHPIAQAGVMIALYFFHMLVLSKVAVPFPFQLLPNTHGLFQSIGMDSLAGKLAAAAHQLLHIQQHTLTMSCLAPFSHRYNLFKCPGLLSASSRSTNQTM